MLKYIRCSGCSKILFEISTSFGDRVTLETREDKIYCEWCKEK